MTRQYIGPYEIVGPLGEGGMGQVLRCVDPHTHSHVAVKVLHPALVANLRLVERFARELQVLLDLRNHPNIVTVLGFVDSPFALVMELLDGETLHDRLGRSESGLSEAEIYRFFPQVVEAVGFAHERGFLHRDIKSANIMLVHLGSQAHVKVMDFGLAGFVEGSALTRMGTRMGTPVYMAPEQHLGGAIDVRTDVYALGVLLYEMCAGCLPFSDRGKTDFQLMQEHISAPVPLVTASRPDLVPALDEIILRALQKKPERRYASCADLLTDVRLAERGAAVNYGLRSAALEGRETGTTRMMSAISDQSKSRPARPRERVPAPPTFIGEGLDTTLRGPTARTAAGPPPTVLEERPVTAAGPTSTPPDIATPRSQLPRAWLVAGTMIVVAAAAAVIFAIPRSAAGGRGADGATGGEVATPPQDREVNPAARAAPPEQARSPAQADAPSVRSASPTSRIVASPPTSPPPQTPPTTDDPPEPRPQPQVQVQAAATHEVFGTWNDPKGETWLTLRESPGSRGRELAQLTDGTRLRVVACGFGTADAWCSVRVSSGRFADRQGYVHSKWIRGL